MIVVLGSIDYAALPLIKIIIPQYDNNFNLKLAKMTEAFVKALERFDEENG